MLQRIHCLLIKELAQLRRDRRLFGILIMAPLIQILVLGFAVNTDVRDITMAVRDNDHTQQSREFVRSLGASGYFQIKYLNGSSADDAQILVGGKAGLILVIPQGFAKHLLRKEPAPVQILVDGADSNFGVQGLNYFSKAARMFSEGQVREMLLRISPEKAVKLPGVQAETRVWYNPELKSRYYMVPAIMAQLLMVATMIVTSMAMVKEREEGTLEQVIVTPLRPIELMIGKLLPYFFVGFVEMTIFLPVMLVVFGLPFRGNLLFLYATSGLYILTTLGLGLFISTIARNQQQAQMISMFFVMMPFVMLSGFAFPVENMPPSIQVVAQCIPLKHYLVILRSIFLKGTGWNELWPECIVLLAWGIGIISLASLKFRKRLD